MLSEHFQLPLDNSGRADLTGLRILDIGCALTKVDGLLILATLNRTLKSWLFGIVGAEYVLRLLPRGTHDWRYFVTPTEMEQMLSDHQFTAGVARGMSFNPFTKHWRVSDNVSVNYLLSAKMQK